MHRRDVGADGDGDRLHRVLAVVQALSRQRADEQRPAQRLDLLEEEAHEQRLALHRLDRLDVVERIRDVGDERRRRVGLAIAGPPGDLDQLPEAEHQHQPADGAGDRQVGRDQGGDHQVDGRLHGEGHEAGGRRVGIAGARGVIADRIGDAADPVVGEIAPARREQRRQQALADAGGDLGARIAGIAQRHEGEQALEHHRPGHDHDEHAQRGGQAEQGERLGDVAADAARRATGGELRAAVGQMADDRQERRQPHRLGHPGQQQAQQHEPRPGVLGTEEDAERPGHWGWLPGRKSSLVPAQAGTQRAVARRLGPRFRGDERKRRFGIALNARRPTAPRGWRRRGARRPRSGLPDPACGAADRGNRT